MGRTTAVRRGMSDKKYYTWVGVFILIIVSLLFLVYAATTRIDYVWGWHKLPSAFFFHERVEINTEIEGSVESITPKGDEAVIAIKGPGGPNLTPFRRKTSVSMKVISCIPEMCWQPMGNGSRELWSRASGSH